MNNELYHYGVLGMKWGIRRGDVQGAYRKASDKRARLERKESKALAKYEKASVKANTGASLKYKKFQAKADKYQRKADRKKYGLFYNDDKAAYLQSIADQCQSKATKYKSISAKRDMEESNAKAQYVKARRKAEKWRKAMDKAFSNTEVASLNQETVSNGRAYIYSIGELYE